MQSDSKQQGNSVAAIPADYAGITPYLCVNDAAAAMAFYQQALGATEIMRLATQDGRIMHAEFDLGGTRVMLSDEFPDMNALGPHSIGGSPVTLHVYVEDVDAVAARAIDAGMEVLRPVADQFYGDRGGSFKDPFGHIWSIATHIEDVPQQEVEKRAAALFG